MRSFAGSILVGVTAVTVVACGYSSFAPRVARHDTAIGRGVPRTPMGGTGTPVPSDLPDARRASDARPMITVCGNALAAAGYIATDHVSSSACPNPNKIIYNALQLEDYTQAVVGSTMLICAGQMAPRDWQITSTDTRKYTQCAREPSDRSTDPTVVEMLRLR